MPFLYKGSSASLPLHEKQHPKKIIIKKKKLKYSPCFFFFLIEMAMALISDYITQPILQYSTQNFVLWELNVDAIKYEP